MPAKRVGIISLICLVIGFLLGFVPEHIAKSHVEQSVVNLTSQGQATQSTLHHTERQLRLNEFAVQAAIVSADANHSNYADASASASALFTSLRDYVDKSGDEESKQSINEVLQMRDTTISSLAKADAGVRPVLGQIFDKLKGLSMKAKT